MRKVLLSLFIFFVTFFAFSATKVSAKVISGGKGSVNIEKTEVINDDLFIGAQTAEIAGTVNGDVFIGAQTVKITGIINGNLHVGSNTLDLNGKIKGNVYIGAQSVLISGANIGGSLLAGAATINIDKSSAIGGAILVGTGSLSIDSRVGRSLYAGTGSLAIGENTTIGKDLYYAINTQEQANISEKAKISGNIYKSETNLDKKNLDVFRMKMPAISRGFRFGVTTFISFLGALIVGFLYFRFFGKSLSETSKLVSGSFWKSLGIGFLISIAFIPGLIILLITIIGIPVAGIAIVMLTLYSYLAKIVVGSALGNWISIKFKWKISTYGAFALGLLALYILKMLPVVGFLTGFVVLWAGLGALTLKTFSKTN